MAKSRSLRIRICLTVFFIAASLGCGSAKVMFRAAEFSANSDENQTLSSWESMPVESLGALNWGSDSQGQAWSAVSLRRRAQQFDEGGEFLRSFKVRCLRHLPEVKNLLIPQKFSLEGVIETAPAHRLSEKSVLQMGMIFDWSVCATLAPSDLASTDAYSAAMFGTDGEAGWIGIYTPSGKPIDDSSLLPLLLSLDLRWNFLTVAQLAKTKRWLRKIISSGDGHFEKLPRSSKIHINNHQTWRLALRATAAKILRDEAELIKTKELLLKHVPANFAAPENWHPRVDCPEQAKAYGGIDFQTRDALHYHVFNLFAYAQILTFVPEVLNREALSAIHGAFDFLKPYFLKEKQHIEFLCTTVKFDRLRAEAGVGNFKNQPWLPERARNVLRLGRLSFPEIRDWTTSVVDQKYQSWIQFVVFLKAD